MTTAVRPPRIERGQTLGIVAPAGPVKREVFERGLARLGDAFKLRIAESVTALLLELHAQLQTITVVVTHNPELAAKCGRQFRLVDGKLAS